MKKLGLVGILSAFSILGIASILTPAKASSDGLPVGTIVAWGGASSSIPAGWMLCNGKAVSKATYPELFAALGTSWGSSGTNFNLPDLRGRFLRGDDAGTGRDPDAKKRTPSNPGGSATGVGSVQGDSLQNHTHDQDDDSHLVHQHYGAQYVDAATSGFIAGNDPYMTESSSQEKAVLKGVMKYGTKSKASAGEESRPENASVNFIIKVK
jgi:microcystin-dependent protein